MIVESGNDFHRNQIDSGAEYVEILQEMGRVKEKGVQGDLGWLACAISQGCCDEKKIPGVCEESESSTKQIPDLGAIDVCCEEKRMKRSCRIPMEHWHESRRNWECDTGMCCRIDRMRGLSAEAQIAEKLQ